MAAIASVAKKSTISTTTYIIKGLKPDVDAEVEKIFRSYPPLGYGTRLSSEAESPGNAAEVVAIVHRANSCD